MLTNGGSTKRIVEPIEPSQKSDFVSMDCLDFWLLKGPTASFCLVTIQPSGGYSRPQPCRTHSTGGSRIRQVREGCCCVQGGTQPASRRGGRMRKRLTIVNGLWTMSNERCMKTSPLVVGDAGRSQMNFRMNLKAFHRWVVREKRTSCVTALQPENREA